MLLVAFPECQVDDDKCPNPSLLFIVHFYLFSAPASHASHWLFISMKYDSFNEGVSCSESFPCSSVCVEPSVSQKESGKGKMTGKSSEHEDDRATAEVKHNCSAVIQGVTLINYNNADGQGYVACLTHICIKSAFIFTDNNV